MIRYDLHCDQDHKFDSWFAGASAFDRLLAAGHVVCPDCGSQKVQKALMAPAIGKTTRAPVKALSTPRDDREAALQDLRRKIEANSEYVGPSFPTEVRAIHEGRAPERAIYGEAKPEEARAMIEEGLPVLPLPFAPGAKAN